jgi:hypothetical protein
MSGVSYEDSWGWDEILEYYSYYYVLQYYYWIVS